MSPRFLRPISFAGASVNTISHVGEPWMPSLFSRRRTLTHGPFSTSRQLRPRPSLNSGSVRARTSSTSPHPFVMKRFTPLTRQTPSLSW